MMDTAQVKLAEPLQADWDNWGKGSAYQPPPPAKDDKGQYIVYYAIVEKATEKPSEYAMDDQGNYYLNYALDPFKIVDGEAKGLQLKFVEVSTRPFTKLVNGERVPIKGNPNALGNYLRACGLTAKPQTNDQYRAAVKASLNKRFGFVGDWEARNKDTGEIIKGFINFPDDPKRPGQKKAILEKGDFYTVRDTNGSVIDTKRVEAEVLFANFRHKFFQDPTRGVRA
jgi:hypothetical protein